MARRRNDDHVMTMQKRTAGLHRTGRPHRQRVLRKTAIRAGIEQDRRPDSSSTRRTETQFTGPSAIYPLRLTAGFEQPPDRPTPWPSPVHKSLPGKTRPFATGFVPAITGTQIMLMQRLSLLARTLPLA